MTQLFGVMQGYARIEPTCTCTAHLAYPCDWSDLRNLQVITSFLDTDLQRWVHVPKSEYPACLPENLSTFLNWQPLSPGVLSSSLYKEWVSAETGCTIRR